MQRATGRPLNMGALLTYAERCARINSQIRESPHVLRRAAQELSQRVAVIGESRTRRASLGGMPMLRIPFAVLCVIVAFASLASGADRIVQYEHFTAVW
jgi:hypothetical protein